MNTPQDPKELNLKPNSLTTGSIGPYVPSGMYTGGEKGWFTGFGGDILRTPAHAFEGAVRDTSNFVNWLAGSEQRFSSDEIGMKFLPGNSPMHSMGGELLAGFGSAFVLGTGLNVAQSAAKIPNIAAKAGALFEGRPVASYFARHAAQGSMVDFIMSERGPGLSSMLQSFDSETAKQIGGILNQNWTGTELEARLRGALEGKIVGALLPGTISALKAAYFSRLGKRTSFANQFSIEAARSNVKADGSPDPMTHGTKEILERLRKYDIPPAYTRTVREEAAARRAANVEAMASMDNLIPDDGSYGEFMGHAWPENNMQAEPIQKPGPPRRSGALTTMKLTRMALEEMKSRLAPREDAAPITDFVSTADDPRIGIERSFGIEPELKGKKARLQENEQGGETPVMTIGEAAKEEPAPVTLAQKPTPSSAAEAPKPEAAPEPSSPLLLGKSAELVYVDNGIQRRAPVQYALVENDALQPSHDPLNGFQKNPLGDVNERPYGDPGEEGARERNKVHQGASNPDAALFNADSPSATDGPAIVNGKDLSVISGNGRTMMQRLAYSRGNGTAEQLRKATLEAAKKFGIEGGENLKNPQIVRVMAPEHAGEKGSLSRVLNEPLTQKRGVVTDALSRAAQLTPQDMAEVSSILGESTLAEALNDSGKALKLLQIFAPDGMEIYTKQNVVTDAGKATIRQAFLGATVPSFRTVSQLSEMGMKNLENTLIRVAPSVLRVTKSAPNFPIREIVTKAVDGMLELKESGLLNVEQLRGQTTLAPLPWREDPRAFGLMRVLEKMTQNQVVDMMQKMADNVVAFEEAKGAPALFEGGINEGMSPTDAFNSMIGAHYSEGSNLRGGRMVGYGVKSFVESAVAGGAHREIMERFVSKIGAAFDDVASGTAEGKGGLFARYVVENKVMNRFIAIGQNFLHGDSVAIHEAYHNLHEFLTPEERASVQAEFERAKANSDDPGAYRFKNVNEYFAVTATDAALAKMGLSEAAARPGFKGLALKAWNAIQELWGAIKDVLGIDRTRRIAERFLSSGMEGRKRGEFTEYGSLIDLAENTDDSVLNALRAAYEKGVHGDVIPHAMSNRQLEAQNARVGDLTTHYNQGSKGVFTVLTQQQRLADEIGKMNPRVTQEEIRGRIAATIHSLANLSGMQASEMLAKLPEKLDKLYDYARANEFTLVDHAKNVVLPSYKAALENRSPENLARFVYNQVQGAELSAGVREFWSVAGRRFAERQQDLPTIGEEVAKRLRDRSRVALDVPESTPETGAAGTVTPTAEPTAEVPQFQTPEPARAKQPAPTEKTQLKFDYEKFKTDIGQNGMPSLEEVMNDPGKRAAIVEAAGGPKAVGKQLQMFAELEKAGADAARLKQLSDDLAKTLNAPNIFQILRTIYVKHLTASPLTWGGVFTGQGALGASAPGEHWLGGFVQRLFATQLKDPEAIAESNRQLAIANKWAAGMFNRQNIAEALKWMRNAYDVGHGTFLGKNGDVMAREGVPRSTQEMADAINAWRAKRELLAPDATKKMWSADNAFFRVAMTALPKYDNAISYASSRILSAADDFIRNFVGRPLGRALLEDAAQRNFPNNPEMWASYVAERESMMFEGGQLATAEKLKERFVEDLRQKGMKDEAKIEKIAQGKLEEFIDQNPEFIDIVAKVEERGHEAAGTIPYDDSMLGQAAKGVSNFVQRAGWPAYFIPFIHVSYSMAKSAGRRMDVNGVREYLQYRRVPDRAVALKSVRSQFAKDMLSGDPYKMTQATGRMASGTLATAFFMSYAAQEDDQGRPMMTGALAKDKNIRQLQQAAGLQEYSIMLPGIGYVSYARLDPFATLLGVVADFTTHAKVNPPEEDGYNILGSVMAAYANNFQNKSYLMGMTQLMDALNSGDPTKLGRMFDRISVSMVPGVGMQTLPWAARLGESASKGYSADREIRGWMDEFMARLPMFREDLPPVRNLFGEEVQAKKFVDHGMLLPFAYHEVDDADAVAQEMRRLQYPFHPPSPHYQGVDLREMKLPNGEYAYDEWQKLTGTIPINGLTLKQALLKEVKSAKYQALNPREEMGKESPRVERLSAIIGPYRQRAWQQLIRKFQDLQPNRISQAQRVMLNAGR